MDYQTNRSGTIIPRVHRYTELASGLTYWHPAANDWVASVEQIQPAPGGAAAIQGQHQVYFPANLYQGVIEMVTPEGQHLKSRPLCLSYFDGKQSAIIGTLTGCIGQIVGSNQVLYAGAFTNAQTGRSLSADIILTYKKGGFEQDVILREQLPSPAALGMNPDATRLEVLTEFLDPPRPVIQTLGLSASSDEQLDFGTVRMVRGRAFVTSQDDLSRRGIPVSKHWTQIEGRTFLIESLPVQTIIPQMRHLPLPNSSSSTNHAGIRKPMPPILARRALPSPIPFRQGTNTMRLASSPTQIKGFVIDYVTLHGYNGAFTFQADTTYYISGDFVPLGTTTIEGGTVIKYARTPAFWPQGALVCQTAPYRPAVLTAVDDDTVGQSIAVSSGSPTEFYGSSLSGYISRPVSGDLEYLRFCYAGLAVGAQISGVPENPSSITLKHCQISTATVQ